MRRPGWRIAVHEAGHAVIGRVLGMVCGEATIVPDFVAETAGVAITHDHWLVAGAWEKQHKYRDIASVLRARIMTLMGGAEAEKVCCRRYAGGDGNDCLQIGFMMEEIPISENDWTRWERRLRAKTRALVRRHRHKIEHIAEALVERRTISGRGIDRLLRQATSADEVRILRRVNKARLRLRREFLRAAVRKGPIEIPPIALQETV